MDPLLAKIREQLPSEPAPFGLLVRGEVLEGQMSAFTKLALATQEGTQKEPGNLFYRFFIDPLKDSLRKLGTAVGPVWRAAKPCT